MKKFDYGYLQSASSDDNWPYPSQGYAFQICPPHGYPDQDDSTLIELSPYPEHPQAATTYSAPRNIRYRTNEEVTIIIFLGMTIEGNWVSTTKYQEH